MTTIKKDPVDVVIVGFGWTGAIMGMEMTDAGLSVVALERGKNEIPILTLPIHELPMN